MSDLLTTNQNILIGNADFDQLVDMMSGTVAESSYRVYRATYDQWKAWAVQRGINPLEVNFSTVGAFLADREGTKASKQRELSALRQLAKMLQILDFENPARRAAYESLGMLKVKTTDQSRDNERQRRALEPHEADKLLRVWREDASIKGKRNRAIIAVLLLSGLRREELTALHWRDIDFTNGVISIRHGKGDKSRQAALFGTEALDALKMWQMEQPIGYSSIFVNLRKGDHFTGDHAMSTTAIWNVVTESAERAGIGHVHPHMLRRTLATELLDQGAPVNHVRDQLGHTNSSTTLNNYTPEIEARQRRKSGRVRYG
jgi:integrase